MSFADSLSKETLFDSDTHLTELRDTFAAMLGVKYWMQKVDRNLNLLLVSLHISAYLCISLHVLPHLADAPFRILTQFGDGRWSGMFGLPCTVCGMRSVVYGLGRG